MTPMGPRLSKFVLTSHITFSVGWLGSVAVFIALAVTGMATENIQLARVSSLGMEISSRYVIVPFCIAALITGVIQSLGTKWGLFKYYWIVVKLMLTLFATVLLLLHLQPIHTMAKMAEGIKFSNTLLPGLRVRLIADAGAGFLAILTILTISVYKPWGRIQNGTTNQRSWVRYILTGFGILLFLMIILHLFGGGMRNH